MEKRIDNAGGGYIAGLLTFGYLKEWKRQCKLL